MHLWLNGELSEENRASLSATAAGTLLGRGVFTTIGVWQGRPFALQRHLERLRRDALALELEIAFTDDDLQLALAEVLRVNAAGEGMARLTVTARGDGRWNTAAGSDVSILARPHGADFDPTRPVRLGISPFRVAPGDALSGIKSTAYAGHWRAWREAQGRGLDDALLLTTGGSICEASRANVFWVEDGVLFTPGAECAPLPGIARALILEWARDWGLTVWEGTYRLEALRDAEEAFLTASTTGPRPVETLHIKEDVHRFAAPGTITQRLRARWHEACLRAMS